MIFSFFSYEKTPISKDLDAHSTLKALHWKGYPPLLDWDAYQPSTTITVHTEGEKH